MSKRKREQGEAEAEGRNGRTVSKRRKHDRKAPRMSGVSRQKFSVQLVNSPSHLQTPAETPRPAAERSKRRQSQKDQTTQVDNVPELVKAVEPAIVKAVEPAKQVEASPIGQFEKQEKRKDRKRRRKEEGQHKKPSWKVSEPVGGQMLYLDPVFSPDEEYLLLAYDTAINVYSTSTSLLLRRLRTAGAERVSGLSFSPTSSEHLYISTASGVIERWDWFNGRRLDFWNVKVPVHAMQTAPMKIAESANGLVYTTERHTRNRWLITAHRLLGGPEAENTELAVLLVFGAPLTSLKILDGGQLIVATAGSTVIIGVTAEADQPSLKDVNYVWREYNCSEWITSIDIRIDCTTTTAEPPKKRKAPTSGVDIVLGGLKGAIFIYEDILTKLTKAESGSQTSSNHPISPRKLHWHRNAVATVKWSADGNYIISGGEETVLVLWQLETGQRQDLPHLSAAIGSIVVSPSGSSYAVRLGDNSAMILSTSELKPTFSIAGIQIPAARAANMRTPFVPTVDNPLESSHGSHYHLFPATVIPSGTSRLLLAVPATAKSSEAFPHSCYLQTLDVNSGQQIGRQALTRTNITARNIGPQANKVDEPSVTHIQVSHDGQWLATIDEWSPPANDLGHLAFDDAGVEIEQHLHTEVYLKLWAWVADSSTWELVSRVDSPHATTNGTPCRVFDLTSDPSRTGFATVGEDGIVRVWRPTTRKRHGVDVRDTVGRALTSWNCGQVIELPVGRGQDGRLGFSADGSVLAACPSSSSSAVHLIDTESGEIRSSIPELFSGTLFGLGILDRYLIVLSEDLRVWDMVSEDLHFGFSVETTGFNITKRKASTFLAIDHKRISFAVTIPEIRSKARSRIAIFDPERPVPLFTTIMPNVATLLLPASGRTGYYCVDTAAEVRTITPSQSLPMLEMPLSDQYASSGKGLTDIYGNGSARNEEEDRTMLKLQSVSVEAEAGSLAESRSVNSEQLAAVLESGSIAVLPPVADLFEKVAALFIGK